MVQYDNESAKTYFDRLAAVADRLGLGNAQLTEQFRNGLNRFYKLEIEKLLPPDDENAAQAAIKLDQIMALAAIDRNFAQNLMPAQAVQAYVPNGTGGYQVQTVIPTTVSTGVQLL